MTSKKIKILIAEDHHLVAKLLSANLEINKDFNVIGILQDGQETIKMAKELKPDVILLDIDMPIVDGMQALKEIKSYDENIKIIMLSNHTESWLIKKSLSQGANGYLTKFADSTELIDSIYAVMDNKTYLCKLSRNHIQQSGAAQVDLVKINDFADIEVENDSFTTRYQRLTKREKEIFKLIVKGNSTKEISDILYISIRTVETHRKNILKKMDVKNSVEMIRNALEVGMFED